MRSINRSACFISSMDSARIFFQSRSYPQFSHIRACTKYWLIAVNSAVRISFKTVMTWSWPFMAVPREKVGKPLYTMGVTVTHPTGAVNEGGEQRAAGVTVGAGAARSREIIQVRRASRNGGLDGAIRQPAAKTDDHGAPPGSAD